MCRAQRQSVDGRKILRGQPGRVASEPVIPLRLFKDRTIALATAASTPAAAESRPGSLS